MWEIFELIYKTFKGDGVESSIDYIEGNVGVFLFTYLCHIYITYNINIYLNNVISYLLEMLPSLDNYISYGAEVFAQNSNLQSMIYDIIETVRCIHIYILNVRSLIRIYHHNLIIYLK